MTINDAPGAVAPEIPVSGSAASVIVGNPPYNTLENLEKIHVRYPRWNRIYNKIDHCRIWSKNAADPHCLLLVGKSGVGKTTIIEHYIKQHQPRDTAAGRHVPVLFAQIPSPATIKSLATQLLLSVGDPMADKGTLDAMTMRLVKFIKECGVELIILDEFQHFIDKDKKNKVLLTVSDWLKNLINWTKKPIILVGMPESVRVLTENDQLARRFSAKERLMPFEWRGDAKTEFVKFLKEVSKQIPLQANEDLYSLDTAQRMFWATEGRAALVMKIVKMAARRAITDGRPSLSMSDFAEAYAEEIAAGADDEINPFEGAAPAIDSFGIAVKSQGDDTVAVGDKVRTTAHKSRQSQDKPDFREAVAGRAA